MKDKRNPVAKNMNEFNKPKTFRDRKKEVKLGEVKRDHPKHQPYTRCPANLHNLLLEDDTQEDLWRDYLQDSSELEDPDNFPMESYYKGKAFDE